MIHEQQDSGSIFGRAIQIASPEEREVYLVAACGANAPLRAEVDDLLATYPKVERFLERPAAETGTTVDRPGRLERAGSKIGPYKLLQEIGEGGMGVVWMAEQEQPVRRRVALKVIKPGMDSRQVIARFEAERQALAMMDHQNIAKVLEVGTTDSGRPYFVMELVHGVPITKFCEDNRLTPRQRLELFVPVCHAIQHAHQKGVIHRDIKPTNILVTMYDDKPVPKVIDFGVAKAVEQRLTEKTLFTQYGTLVGTFEYMSPEQAEMNALGVDTRSDIYSLGVLLYELLTGTTPLERPKLREAALVELVRLIKEDEPQHPSIRLSSTSTLPKFAAACRTEPARLSQLLRGELDWIVMKCLEKDRTRRYETANGLARDISRYLCDEPVEACPPSLRYRLSKFTRRHKTPLTFAAAILGLLLSGAAISTWQAIRAKHAEAIALDSERKARAAAEAAEQAKDAEAAQRKLAEANEQVAIRERNNTLAAQEEQRETLYAAEMNVIQAAWESQRYSRVSQLLAQQRPAAGHRDLRGFEWHYWQRQLNRGHLQTVEAPGLAFSAPTFLLKQKFTKGAGRIVANFRGAEGRSRGFDRLTVIDAVTGGEQVPPFASVPDLPVTGDRTFTFTMSDDGKTLAATSGRGRTNAEASVISIRDGQSGQEQRRIEMPGNVTELALTADGTRLAAVYVEQPQAEARTAAVKIFDTSTGEVVQSLPMLPWNVLYGNEILWHPDGSRLLRHGISRESKDNKDLYRDSFQVTDIATGQTVWQRETPLRIYPLQACAWRPDGKLIVFFEMAEAGIAEKHHVQLWDSETGAMLAILDRHSITTKNDSNITFSGDSQKLAAVFGENEIHVWQLPQLAPSTGGAAVHIAAPDVKLRAGTSAIQALAFTTSNKELRCLSGTSIITLDATAAENAALGPEVADFFTYSSISDDATKAAIHVLSGSLYCMVWDLVRDRELFRVPMTPGWASKPTFSPDGRKLAMVRNPAEGEEARQLLILDSQTGELLKTIPLDKPVPDMPGIMAISFRPDGQQIAAKIGQRTDQARLVTWDIATGKETLSFAVSRTAISGVYSADGASLIVISSPGREATFYDAATGQQQNSVSLSSSPTAAFLDVQYQVVACSQGSDCVLLDLTTGRERLRLPGLGGVNGFAISPDGSRLALGHSAFASIGSAAALTIADAKSGQPLLSLNRLGNVEALAFSPDGRRLVATFRKSGPGAMKPIQIWDATPLPEKP